MATLNNDLDHEASPSPTPPPIPSQSNGLSDNTSYRRSSRKNITKTIASKTGQLIHGAPTKQHRLLEYFLVISYGNELKIRFHSPLMDIFDNFDKHVHHHHAYIIHPNQKKSRNKNKKKQRDNNKDDNDENKEEKEEEKHIQLSPNSKSPKLPQSPPPPTPPRPPQHNANKDSIDYTNIEKLRASSADLYSSNSVDLSTNPNPFGSLRLEPSVIDRFPPFDHVDTAIISTDTQLQYFCLPTGLFLTKFPSLPIFYTFVWTPETGEHLFGCCLRFFEPVAPSKIFEFCKNCHNIKDVDNDSDTIHNLKYLTLADCKGYFAPKCICIISYHSFIQGYRVFLTELYRLSLTPSKIPIERYLCNFFLECPLPPRGYFSVGYNIGDKSFKMSRSPSNNPLSISSISTRVLFELFSIETIMNIYKSILLEEKILFISTQYSILSVICEIFISLLYPFTWPHVYIPMLPEDFLAFLKAPTVFIIGTHKSLLLQIGDELDDDILVVDINSGSIQHGFNDNNANNNSTMHIELPKHEKLKLVRFLTPVSNLLYGSHQHDFHQLDLAFPVAPTPDMIEQQELLQQQRFKKMKIHSDITKHAFKRQNSDSLRAISPPHTPPQAEEYKNNENNDSNSSPNKAGKKSKRFSLSFRGFKRPTLGKMTGLTSIGMNLRGRSDSIEPPIKSYTNSPFGRLLKIEKEVKNRNKPKHKRKMKRSQSETLSELGNSFKKQDSGLSGNLQDIVESPINAMFDDAAVRNGFLRFWLSIFRSYQECVVRPNNYHTNTLHNHNVLNVNLTEPIYEDSATKTLDKKSPIPTTEEEVAETKKNAELSKSKSGSSRSMTSSLHSANSTNSVNSALFGQSVESIFDEDKFLKSSPSQSRPFLTIFLGTESFHRFISKCVFEADTNTDVKYFNEKIIQKLGRSRFTKAQPTPFLNNKDYVISHEFACPSPYISDLEADKKYIYPEWPKLDPNLYCKARRKYKHINKASKSSKDITSNYMLHSINDEENSITFEPSKSQTITSTIFKSPPPNNANNNNNTITPADRHNNDYNIIREEDENAHGDNDEDRDIIVLQLGDKERADSNPFSHDRVTYHLWFYIFIRTLHRDGDDDNSQQRALHLMMKIMAQMKNESVGLPDKWVFREIIEAMDRMKWGHHVIKLVEVMHELQYNLDATIYSSLLAVLTKQYGALETAYNILGNLPTSADAQVPDTQVRDRNNSLLTNCSVKPESKRKKYYETIKELKNRFSATFPERRIVIKQECPHCEEAIHDVHIRMGWRNNDKSLDTQCPKCNKRFDAKFLIKESEQYKVWFHDVNSLKCLQFFKMRGDVGTYVQDINFEGISNYTRNKEIEDAIVGMVCVGDQIVNINGLDVTDKSLLNIYQIMKDPPRTNNSNLMQIPDIEESLSSQNSKSHDIEAKRNNNNEEVARKQHSKLKKQSTKSKLMKLMKLNDKSDRSRGYDPICVTFRRVVLCPYFSPLILYREIKKVIQNHALSSMERVVAMMDVAEDENENNSYRKNKNKKDIKKLLQQSGISAISSIDFRMKHCKLFWNLAWHFSNLRLPLHFLQTAFDDKNEMNTPQIDELIDFVPLQQNKYVD